MDNIGRRFGEGDTATYMLDNGSIVRVIVRFAGRVNEDDMDTWFGFELADASTPSFQRSSEPGRGHLRRGPQHDGAWCGERYFSCEPGRGHYCEQSALRTPPVASVLAAAEAHAASRGSAVVKAEDVAAGYVEVCPPVPASELTVGMHLWHGPKEAVCTVRWIRNRDVFVEFYTNVGDTHSDTGNGQIHGVSLWSTPRLPWDDCCSLMHVSESSISGVACVDGLCYPAPEHEAMRISKAARRLHAEATEAAEEEAQHAEMLRNAEGAQGDDDALFDGSSAAAPETPRANVEARLQQQIAMWEQSSETRGVCKLSGVVFGAMDWDDDLELTFLEFTKGWYHGQIDQFTPTKQKKMVVRLGGNEASLTIKRDKFISAMVHKFLDMNEDESAACGHCLRKAGGNAAKAARKCKHSREGLIEALDSTLGRLMTEKEHQVLHADHKAEATALAVKKTMGHMKNALLKSQISKIAREKEAQARSIQTLREQLEAMRESNGKLIVASHTDAVTISALTQKVVDVAAEAQAVAGSSHTSSVEVDALRAQVAEKEGRIVTLVETQFDIVAQREALQREKDELYAEKLAVDEQLIVMRAGMLEAEAAAKVAAEAASGPAHLIEVAGKITSMLEHHDADATRKTEKLNSAIDNLAGATRVMLVVRPFFLGCGPEFDSQITRLFANHKKVAPELRRWRATQAPYAPGHSEHKLNFLKSRGSSYYKHVGNWMYKGTGPIMDPQREEFEKFRARNGQYCDSIFLPQPGALDPRVVTLRGKVRNGQRSNTFTETYRVTDIMPYVMWLMISFSFP